MRPGPAHAGIAGRAWPWTAISPRRKAVDRLAGHLPPLRFLRLIRVVRCVGVVPVDVLCDLTPAKTRAYCEDLLDAAGPAAPTHHRLPRMPAHAQDLSPMGSLRRLFHDAHVASSHLRRPMPAALPRPARRRSIGRTNWSMARQGLQLGEASPLMSVGGRSAHRLDLIRFAECAVAGAYQRLLWQLIGDTGPLRFCGLPTDGAGLAAATERAPDGVLRERTERPALAMQLGDDAVPSL